MDTTQLHLNDEMRYIISTITDMIFVTFNESDFKFIIDIIKENLDIKNSDSDSDSGSDISMESEDEDLTIDEIDFLNRLHFIHP